MNYFEAIILGLIQGITEFFPISSSGHLIIFRKIFNLHQYNLLLEVALHIGTLFSILFYWREDLKKIFRKDNNTLLMIVVGSIPAGLIGFLYKNKISELFYDINSISFLIFTYFALSCLLFISKYYLNNKKEQIGLISAFLIGIAQSFAIIPGLSRSGLTIIMALFLGIKFKHAMKFSFLLAIPILIFAGLESINDNFILLVSNYNLIIFLLIGITSAAISGYGILFLLEKIIQKNKFWHFSFYCLLISIILVIFNYVN